MGWFLVGFSLVQRTFIAPVYHPVYHLYMSKILKIDLLVTTAGTISIIAAITVSTASATTSLA